MDESLRRFLSKVKRAASGCWEWTAAVRTWSREPWDGGYGAFKVDGRVVRAHKWFYERLVGPVPKSQVLLHVCDNRRCVNIYHLYPDSQLQNVKDMLSKRLVLKDSLGEVS